MAKAKRSVLGSIADRVIHIESSPKGFEAFGHDKLGRKVVLARRTALDAMVLDGAEVAQCLADFTRKPVTLRLQSENREEFFPTTA
ncbi:hypothetical protein M1B72_05525 [Geomonas paludis]|uniref:Uncharacterized protein n=1 Tax=Geomonas paludis TaxID=2740185 RepID=A0A6V8N2C1_9BACT|nr:hypothetical protein [Geomonas paludis]UPU37169.1 hypothetical protein M1B72_05525 [Geomonas paludis]GFO66114.1 hypothetical protein GMPD_40330 [Geomonas paludis]